VLVGPAEDPVPLVRGKSGKVEKNELGLNGGRTNLDATDSSGRDEGIASKHSLPGKTRGVNG